MRQRETSVRIRDASENFLGLLAAQGIAMNTLLPHAKKGEVSLQSFGPNSIESMTEGRRGFLKYFGRGGMAIIAGLSGVFAAAKPAAAGLSSPCCSLASNTRCSGCDEDYTCSKGVKRLWYCQAGMRIIGCGECQAGTGTCWEGSTYYCSIWWDDGAGCG